MSVPSETVQVSSSSEATVIIFDWDDTLLASSFIKAVFNCSNYTIEEMQHIQTIYQNEFQSLHSCITQLLEIARQLGKMMYLISNADLGWIRETARVFMPQLVPAKFDRVISAKEVYADDFVNTEIEDDNYTAWKQHAFYKAIIPIVSSAEQLNIISIGDSSYEQEAVFKVGKQLRDNYPQKVCIKSVKLLEKSDPATVTKQPDLLSKKLKEIHSTQGDLDLIIVKSPKGEEELTFKNLSVQLPIPRSESIFNFSELLRSPEYSSSSSDVSQVHTFLYKSKIRLTNTPPTQNVSADVNSEEQKIDERVPCNLNGQ